MDSQRIPLGALSDRQRRLVQRHLPLVQATLRRNERLSTGRERSELFQEGCLALIEALRNHDPLRHGSFPAFAMARIHYAISRYVHEHQCAIRIPFITQRRRRGELRETPDAPPTGVPLPRVVSMKDARRHPGPSLSSRRDARPAGPDGATIGEVMRERYDRAMKAVVSEMMDAPRCRPGHREVVRRCSEERWQIPEPGARTSIRALARKLNCSVGRITHCEERFRRRLARRLKADPALRMLDGMARCDGSGLDAHLHPRDLARLRPDAPDPDSGVPEHGERDQ